MNEEIAIGVALIASAGLFGGTLGKFVRFGSFRAPFVGFTAGAALMVLLIATGGVDTRRNDETGCTDDNRAGARTPYRTDLADHRPRCPIIAENRMP